MAAFGQTLRGYERDAANLGRLSATHVREFDRLQRQWAGFGEAGYEWAIKSVTRPVAGDPVAAYLGWGRELWETLQRRAKELGLKTSGHQALDFGCGPGRVAQALSESYEAVLGLDVAPKMIELADRINRRPERCSFRQWVAPDLADLASGRFDLTLCAFVVQHLPRWLAARYIRELVRTAAPGGTIVLQFHGDVTLPVVRHLPSRVLSMAYNLARRLHLYGPRLRGPWEVHLARPAWVRSLFETSGASVAALDRAPEPEGWMVSYWLFARREYIPGRHVGVTAGSAGPTESQSRGARLWEYDKTSGTSSAPLFTTRRVPSRRNASRRPREPLALACRGTRSNPRRA